MIDWDAELHTGCGCSIATLDGDYIYAQDGYQKDTTADAPFAPFAQAGRDTFDGMGNMSGVYSGNFNGTITRGNYDGTYTVEPDCSGSVTLTDNLGQTSHYDMYVAADGSELVFVQTDPNFITAAYEYRVS